MATTNSNRAKFTSEIYIKIILECIASQSVKAINCRIILIRSYIINLIYLFFIGFKFLSTKNTFFLIKKKKNEKKNKILKDNIKRFDLKKL